ncbi:MAG: hypothetical protein ACJ77Z_07815 [Thermoleophilaceae bacterium]
MARSKGSAASKRAPFGAVTVTVPAPEAAIRVPVRLEVTSSGGGCANNQRKPHASPVCEAVRRLHVVGADDAHGAGRCRRGKRRRHSQNEPPPHAE